MRRGKGCLSCKDRHLKCVTKSGTPACARCIEAGRECYFGPNFRFKQVAYVDSESKGRKSRTELSYGEGQIWMSVRRPVSFILEDGFGLEYGVPEDEPQLFGVPAPEGLAVDPTLQGRKSPSDSVRHAAVALVPVVTNPSNFVCRPSEDWYRNEVPSVSDRALRPLTAASAVGTDVSSPASIAELSRRHGSGGHESVSSHFNTSYPMGEVDQTQSARTARPSLRRVPSLSRREAHLIQHLIQKIGPWMDVCDLSFQFAHELPRRAMHNPMVMFAILAISSRHLGCLSNTPDSAEASFYHGHCLRLVIDVLSGPESLYDDNLLATFICLRVYEEMHHPTDELHHLRGISRLLRMIPSFARSGGFGEALCWQFLRQDVYISMIASQPPSIPLEEFEFSSAQTFRDDGACANIIILLLAKILRLTYETPLNTTSKDWDDMTAKVEAWNHRRLRLFQPIYHEDVNFVENRPFPIIHMISPPQVAALQYYHACKVYLLLHRPISPAISSFHAAKHRRTLERDVATNVSIIVGLAESNPFVENANFTAAHLLRVAGHCITNHFQRERALAFLVNFEKIMGWTAATTIDLLQSQWHDLDSPDG